MSNTSKLNKNFYFLEVHNFCYWRILRSFAPGARQHSYAGLLILINVKYVLIG